MFFIGLWRVIAIIDECGVCNGSGIDQGACDCDGNILDCNGICGGGAENDECGVCGGDGPDENYDCDGNCIAGIDCAGTCGGNAIDDECGVCAGDGPDENYDCDGDCIVEADCNGLCGGSSQIDACGNCGGQVDDITNCTGYGCMDEGACNYNASATIESNSCIFPEENYDCDGNCATNVDCAGVCGGAALDDECGVCAGDGPEENYDCDGNCVAGIDCAGVCGGVSQNDACGVCDGDSSSCAGCMDPDYIEYDSSATIDDGSCITLSSEYISVAQSFKLLGAYPNPFNPSTTIRFQLPGQSNVTLDIYNLSGMRVFSIDFGNMAQGVYSYNFNGEGLSTGPYFAVINSMYGSDSKKIFLMK